MSWPIATTPLGPVSVGSLLWRRRGKIRITALVKATFALIHGGFATPVDPRPIHRDERGFLGRRGASPEWVPEVWPELRRPEVYLTGSAITPNREPSRALAVRLVVWKNHSVLDKTLHVLGERREAHKQPASFTSLPLLWERALSGRNGTNPVGVKDRPAGIIDPRRPLDPAGLGPRSPSWPGRDLGPYLESVGASGSPWEWPESISPEAFGAAPLDQRVDALEGDEWLIVDGMHPELPRFASRLPRPIASAHLRDETGRREAFALSLDTVAIDMNALEVSVLFRGALPLLREHYADLVVEADLELGDVDVLRPVGSTDPNARIAAGLGKGMRLGLDSPAGPPPELAPPPPIVEPPADVAPPSRGLGGMFAAAAVDVGEETFTSPADEATPAAVDPSPAVAGAPLEPSPVAPPPPVVAAAVDAAPAPTSPLPAGTAPKAPEAAPEAGVRGLLIAKLAAKESLADLPLAGADLQGLDLSGAAMSGLNLAGAKLAGATLKGARLSNAKLPGVDLGGADLTGADLSQVDLSRSSLAGASFDEAILLDANLTSCEGKGASFRRARAQRALFAQGKWSECSFQEADLTGADLSGSELHGARLDKVTLVGARMVDVRGSQVSAIGADLSDSNLAGVTLTGSNCSEVRAPRTVWDRAVLDQAVFRGAALDSAGFARAHLDGADFSGATLSKASLMGVTGERTVFTGANLEGVDLRQGKLPEALFDNAKLCKANALKATLNQGNFSGADLSATSLRSAKLRAANLTGATLRDCDLRDADLDGADLRGADRQGAKLAGASLKGAQEDP